MESETSPDTFGSYLKSCRVKQKMAIETVAIQTKIPVHCLRAIEEGAHDRLPQRVYVKSFIRTYAAAVGANADVAADLYLADLKLQETSEQQKLRRREKLRMVRRVIMTACVIVGMVLLLRFGDFFLDTAPLPPTEAPVRVNRPGSSATETAAAGDRQPAAKAQRMLKLKIVAVEQTWLKVIVDGQHAKSYNLKPEERLELEGTDNFNLMIGNATGVQIFLDERPVKIFGSSGQVVSLKIP
ncbi:helix-turn-helix domain-containing protein [Desulfosarcina sp.]|uniref:helix-turn-helix domain-containing protein n=1 Tax=Desulfosarcina sp. TaxID=2027861 RepID=UPI003970F0EB